MTSTTPVRLVPIDAVTESNHRIANHLATLVSSAKKEVTRLRAGPGTIDREAAIGAINSLASKIAAIATLHRTIAASPSTAELSLESALAATLQPLTELYGQRLRVELSIGSGCQVSIAQASVLTLAFAEIVTNAMKYAHPTGLPVEISVVAASTADGHLMLEVADDGVGLPDGFDCDRDAGVGLKMLHYMIESLGGDLRTSSNELGLSFSIALPPESRPERPRA